MQYERKMKLILETYLISWNRKSEKKLTAILRTSKLVQISEKITKFWQVGRQIIFKILIS